jgi:hypothetical protein
MARNDPKEVDFMLRRSLGILLSDGKEVVRKPREVNFEFTEIEGSAHQTIYYGPILLFANMLRLSGELSTLIKKEFPIFYRAVKGSAGIETVDKFATNTNFLKGCRSIVYQKNRFKSTQFDIFGFLIYEINCLCIRMRDVLVKTGCLQQQPWLKDGLSKLENIINQIDQLQSRCSFVDWSRIGQEFYACEQIMALTIAEDVLLGKRPFLQQFAEYINKTHHFYRKFVSHHPFISRLFSFRKQFIALTTQVGTMGQYAILQTRAPEYLFEIWCFMEFTRRLMTKSNRRVIQHSFLRMKDKNFPGAKFSTDGGESGENRACAYAEEIATSCACRMVYRKPQRGHTRYSDRYQIQGMEFPRHRCSFLVCKGIRC